MRPGPVFPFNACILISPGPNAGATGSGGNPGGGIYRFKEGEPNRRAQWVDGKPQNPRPL